MHDTDRVLALTEAAMYCALAISLLSLQFVIPVLFVVMVWLIPVVFAVTAVRLPLRIAVTVCVLIVILSLGVFGPVTGAWAVFYAVFGMCSGWLHRLQIWIVVQICCLTLVFAVLCAVLVALYAELANLSLAEIQNWVIDSLIRLLPVSMDKNIVVVSLGGLIVGLSAAIAVVTVFTVKRVLARLS